MRNYIALAIPFFFLLIGVEVWVARRRRIAAYRFNDAVVDLSCGIAQQVLLVFFAGALVGAYAFVYAHGRLVTFAPGSPWPWLIAFVLIDFSYYWWHRLSHEVGFLWAVHVVHHQSEDFNLAVALRQAVGSVWTILPFHLPLALLGVPTQVFLTVDAASTLYQFWIHTELVGKLGWFERVFNTPSQHRVHHAVNPRYLDRNYAATLCVWDRLFGTFQEEEEPPVYGLVEPLRSFNPLWAQVHYWHHLWAAARAAPRALDKVKLWFMPPTFRGTGVSPHVAPQVARETAVKHDPKLSPRVAAWLAVQLALVVAGTTALLFYAGRMSAFGRGAAAAVILLTVAGAGGLIEGKRWAAPLEAGRLAAAIALALLGIFSIA